MTQPKTTTPSELKSSDAWYREITDGIILMATGWPSAVREKGDIRAELEFDQSWLEPITREEFLARRAKSVVLFQP